MSDSTSCGSFANVYALLADDNLSKKEIAEELWKYQRKLDFWMGDMDIDEELVKLGLAKKCEKCDGAVIYKDYEGHHECDG